VAQTDLHQQKPSPFVQLGSVLLDGMELPPKIKENKATTTYDIVLGPFKASEEVVQQSARKLLLQNVLYPTGNGQPEDPTISDEQSQTPSPESEGCATINAPSVSTSW